jgi:hypothetical protein
MFIAQATGAELSSTETDNFWFKLKSVHMNTNFSFVPENEAEKARVFVPGKPSSLV